MPQDVEQWDPYEKEYSYTLEETLTALISYMRDNGMDSIQTGTRIIIVPGYRFKVVDVLVTNFHQPQSTLLLLISAFVGGDWKTIYEHALNEGLHNLRNGNPNFVIVPFPLPAGPSNATTIPIFISSF